MGTKIAASVILGVVLLGVGFALAMAAQEPSRPPMLSVQTPIGTVTGEECLEVTEDIWTEPPEGVGTGFEPGCVAYVYPVTTP